MHVGTNSYSATEAGGLVVSCMVTDDYLCTLVILCMYVDRVLQAAVRLGFMCDFRICRSVLTS